MGIVVWLGPFILDMAYGLSSPRPGWLGPWIKESTLIWMSPQRKEKDPSVSLKVAKNMSKLVARAYITE